MKSKDIGLLAVIGIVSAVVAVIVSGWLIPSGDKSQAVEVVKPISSDFSELPKEYFNTESINPTKEIQIGQDPNSNPFNQ